MRRLIVVGTLLVFAAACTPSLTPASPPTEAISTLPAASPTSAPGAATQPAPAASPAMPPRDVAPVSLEILTPQDNAVVNTQQVAVTGRASPGAVVTVNDDILIVGPDGQFQDTVTLAEGLNLIEVIASNASGSEASAELTVTYEP